jgi:hypothetical protein
MRATILALTATSTPTSTPGPTKIPVTKRSERTYYAVTDANLRPCPQLVAACAPVSHLAYGEPIMVTGEVDGDSVQGNTRWFRVSLDNRTLYAHSSVLSEANTSEPSATSEPPGRGLRH